MTKLKSASAPNRMRLRLAIVLLLTVLLLAVGLTLSDGLMVAAAPAEQVCNAPYISISKPLNDLGPEVYVRPTTGATGYIGGLYPGGSNSRPPAHEAAGLAAAQRIQPLDASGKPDPVNGKIGLVSIGMSNTEQEFDAFLALAAASGDVDPQVVIVNGSRGSLVSGRWADEDDTAWTSLAQRVTDAGLSAQQVQVAWVKLAQFGAGDFPEKAKALQAEMEQVARNLRAEYPATQIAYYSSRSRAYVYWTGLSPEPTAFETAFAVRWMIEKQINGDPTLSFDPNSGNVVAPYLSWGPYLWIDGLKPRSDGYVWQQADLQADCIHPSAAGEAKVGQQLLDFFRTDSTAASWFVSDNPGPPPPGTTPRSYLPVVRRSGTGR